MENCFLNSSNKSGPGGADYSVSVRAIYLNVILQCAVIASATLVVNLANIIAFLHSKKLREKPANLLIFFLGIINIYQAATLLVAAFTAYFIRRRSQLLWSSNVCKISWFVIVSLHVSITQGLIFVTVIALDRILLVSMNYTRYVRFQSRHCIKATIAICWVLSLIPAVIDWGLWYFAKSKHQELGLSKWCISPVKLGFPVLQWNIANSKNTNNLNYPSGVVHTYNWEFQCW